MIDKRRLLADIERLASLLALAGESPFRITAWDGAIRVLARLPEIEISRRVASDTLKDLPGIGAAISTAVGHWARTQTIPELEELKRRFPAGVKDLLEIPGLGVGRVGVLVRELSVTGLEELEFACRANRVAGLKGFGERIQAKVLAGIEQVRRYRQLALLPDAHELARDLAGRLGLHEGRLLVVGSAARAVEVVRDLDLLYVGDLDDAALAARLQMEIAGHAGGAMRLAGATIPVDVHRADPATAVAARVRLVASAEGRGALDARARARGLDLAVARFASETELFAALGLPVVPPELLEDEWGIQAAERGALPDLVGPGDVRGSLHTHTKASDGRSTTGEMAATALAAGHAFLGITDHSASAYYAGGLSADDLARQAIEVDAVGREVPDLALFKGVEAEIRTDGTLDYDEEVLEGLDYVVASVHSRLDQDETEMTARILRAIGHPKVAILAHPTGRLLLGREPVRLDVEAVLQACLRHHVAVEVNANPQRLDLDWRNLRRAAELGVPVAINSDAHDAAGLSDVGWGVATARKAAVPRGLVMNSWPVGRIAAFFRKEAAS